ncbi:hypothetical protein, partial [Pseudarthrobacter sp. PS3-L1]|uniref:hypothetical protein n=1 Tax=Pseudarthrobacter sp. PS3-L1 TaxID=3046207 RepID=UPI0024BAD628
MTLLDRIKARWAAATSGPYEAITTGVRGGDHWYVCAADESIASIASNDGINEEQREPDALAFAAAPTDIAALIAAVEAVEKLADAWEARGTSDMAYSKTIPDEGIAMTILADGASMVENARHIRTALAPVLGDNT